MDVENVEQNLASFRFDVRNSCKIELVLVTSLSDTIY